MLLPNIFLFRKYGQAAAKKRMASLYQAVAVFFFTMSAALIAGTGLHDALLLVSLAIIAVAAFLLRKWMFPYRLTCPSCGHQHEILTPEFKNVYVMDDHLCDSCRKELEPEEEGSDSDDDEEVDEDDVWDVEDDVEDDDEDDTEDEWDVEDDIDDEEADEVDEDDADADAEEDQRD